MVYFSRNHGEKDYETYLLAMGKFILIFCVFELFRMICITFYEKFDLEKKNRPGSSLAKIIFAIMVITVIFYLSYMGLLIWGTVLVFGESW